MVKEDHVHYAVLIIKEFLLCFFIFKIVKFKYVHYVRQITKSKTK